MVYRSFLPCIPAEPDPCQAEGKLSNTITVNILDHDTGVEQ